MKVALGSDHRGVERRRAAVRAVAQLGLELQDLGAPDGEPCDYPDIAADVAWRVADGRADRGVLMCGSGIGMSIAANKIPGVRAALVHDLLGAEYSRRHNDANVLCLSADHLSDDAVAELVTCWLTTEFEGGRHKKRVDKIRALEAMACQPPTRPH